MAQLHLVQPAGVTQAVRKAVFDLEDDLTPAEMHVEALASVVASLENEGHYLHLAWLARKSHGELAEHVKGLRRQFRALFAMTRADAFDGETRP